MDLADDVGPGERQQVVVALQVVVVIGQQRAAEVGFVQPITLDHRTHRAVDEQDALGELLAEAVGGHGHPFRGAPLYCGAGPGAGFGAGIDSSFGAGIDTSSSR